MLITFLLIKSKRHCLTHPKLFYTILVGFFRHPPSPRKPLSAAKTTLTTQHSLLRYQGKEGALCQTWSKTSIATWTI